MKLLALGSGSYKSPLSLRIVAIARQLARSGWDVTLMLPSADKYNNFTPDPNAGIPDVRLVQPWQFATRSAMVNLVPYLFSSLTTILRRRYDAVYLYKPTPITILGLLPRLIFRTPIILDLDDLGSEVMKVQKQSKLQYTLVAWCERLAMRQATGFVVASTYLETMLKTQYPHKRIWLMPNGVNPSNYAITKQHPPRHAIYYFGVIDRLDVIETLLRALPEVLAAVPDTKLTIAGGGRALPAAKRLAKSLGIEKSVTFTDWLKSLDIQKYTQRGDIGVCCQTDTPTVRAASNMKVFQYMAMGTVPVVSDVGDLGVYVKNGAAGRVVPPEDVPRLAASLIELLKDDAQRAAIARKARRLAETEYSWQTLGDALDVFIGSFTKQPERQTSKQGSGA